MRGQVAVVGDEVQARVEEEVVVLGAGEGGGGGGEVVEGSRVEGLGVWRD